MKSEDMLIIFEAEKFEEIPFLLLTLEDSGVVPLEPELPQLQFTQLIVPTY